MQSRYFVEGVVFVILAFTLYFGGRLLFAYTLYVPSVICAAVGIILMLVPARGTRRNDR